MKISNKQLKILVLIWLSPIVTTTPTAAEVIWGSYSSGKISANESGHKKRTNHNTQIQGDIQPSAVNATRRDEGNRKWEIIANRGRQIKWELVSDGDYEKIFKDGNNENKFKPPLTYQEALARYRQIKPRKEDFLPPLRLSPAFPTANILEEGDTYLKFFTISSFSGGAAGGTGNQNYAFRLGSQLTNNLLISAFGSTADDPLYSKIDSHSSSNTPNYWQSFGGSIKLPILKYSSLNIALEGSLESWKVESGPPNIFNNSGKIVSTRNLIGSLSMPISWQANKNVQITLLNGISFLPEKQGKNQGGEGQFYGKNVFTGAGLSWRPINNLTFVSSAIIPFGPGNNNFNSKISFKNKPILGLGVNYDLNPRIGLEGRLTNGFGATPTTGILTIPSANELGYYAGFRYSPSSLDSPQKVLSKRERSLSRGGITVNTALLPPEGTTQIWANIDNSESIFSYIGHSLSNSFQVDLNIGGFRDVTKRSGEKADIVNNYLNNKGEKTRVGGKFVFLSPKRSGPFWAAARISGGKDRYSLVRGEKWGMGVPGYLFTELMVTWEPLDKLAINLNPKVAWTGHGNPKGIGIGANIELSKRFELIPELNIAESKQGLSNGTIGLRWLMNENINIDLYASSASGLQDIGQLMGTDNKRLGARFMITY